MRKFGYMAGGSALAMAVSLGMASAAAAQSTEPTEVETVVITGSLIAGTPEDAALPVDVIGAEELSKQGSPSTVELLRSLPVSSGILGETNQFDARAQGSEGSGSVNLRGLGSQRTLVLMNGRRITPNPFGQVGTGIVDTNIIPSAAIGRVEVLKDGAAATYGSDAIAGVVNFITRKNFEGFEVAGSYKIVDGSDGDYTGSAVWGWVGDSANILLTAGFQHRSELPITERDWANLDFASNPQGGWTGGGGMAFLPTFSPAPGVYAPAAGLQTDVGCAPLGGRATAGGCGFHYTPYDNITEVEDRFQLYGEVNIDVTDTTTFHGELLYAHTDVPEWKTSPSYLALQSATSATSPAPVVAGLAGYWVPSSNPGFAAYQAANPAQLPAFANGAFFPGVLFRPFAMGGNPMFNDGPSEGSREFEAVRINGELSGEFGNGIGWNVALTYSQETGERTGYDTVVPFFEMALRGYGSLAGDASGCTAAETANYTTNAGNNALGCYYFNPFSNAVQSNSITGATNPGYNSAVANNVDLVRWFFRKLSTKQTQRLFVADGLINGKFNWELGGGQPAWALGVQYRREYFISDYNDISDGNVNPCIDTPFNGSTACTVRNGAFFFLGAGFESDLQGDVYATFGELQLPFTDDFNVQLAARYEDYGGEVGSTFNPKIAARWQVADWLALRGSAGTTFRGPPQTNLAGDFVTSLQFIAGSFRAIDIYGNPNLEPETANTYSAGLIVKAGGFKASLDYWRFDFDNPIVAEPSGDIVATMFPAALGTLGHCGDPAYANLQARFTFGGACSTTNISRLRTLTVNGAAVKTSGLDLLADWRFDELLGGSFTVGTSLTYTFEYKTDALAIGGVTVAPAFDAVGQLNYQTTAYPLPQIKGDVHFEYTNGDHNLRLTVRYADSYRDQRAAITGAGKEIDAYATSDLAYRVFLPWDTTFTAVVENMTDEDPPLARLDLNYDPFTASALGRTIKFNIVKKF